MGTGWVVSTEACEGTPGETESEVVVCVGPGGAGKTTTAAALALLAARQGRRACVVTIDPARRLADALGISDVGNEPHLVLPTGRHTWSGGLWAVMLDAQSTFDDLVGRYATSRSQAEAILGNPVYRNIASALSGTQEYMAVEKLYELQESGSFDLIVVDTPPAQHALDFMEAPKHLARLLDNRVFRILMTPTRAGLRAIELGTQLMLRTIAKVAGGQVVADTVQFFTSFEGMEEGFRTRARRADELLHSERTSFCLVCSPRRDTVDEALFLASQLSHAGLEAAFVVVNRCHANYYPLSPGAKQGLEGTSLEPLVANLEQLSMVALREEDQLARVSVELTGALMVRVPLLTRDVSDLEALAEVAGHLEEQMGRGR
ncbi:MAG TPA: ArsA-related P-loop ATPase [Acidimicrobiales bacterium]|nr:ArsA-related P-loop ATPase [Acidimicrobiales bacterium]